MVNQMCIGMVCIADRHHIHLLFPTQLETKGKEMIQQAVLKKKKTKQQNKGTASLDDCSIPETCYKQFTLIFVVRF